MKSTDSIHSICKRYRELFTSDEAMGRSLGIVTAEAGGMVKGVIYPSLHSMLEIQAALRKVAVDEEQKADLFGEGRDEISHHRQR